MRLLAYPEEDAVLRSRARLALSKTYTVDEGAKLLNQLNRFDTADGWRVVLIKLLDPNVFGHYTPILFASLSEQQVQAWQRIDQDDSVKLPKNVEAGYVLLTHILARIGLQDLVCPYTYAEHKGKQIDYLIEVSYWRPTHE